MKWGIAALLILAAIALGMRGPFERWQLERFLVKESVRDNAFFMEGIKRDSVDRIRLALRGGADPSRGTNENGLQHALSAHRPEVVCLIVKETPSPAKERLFAKAAPVWNTFFRDAMLGLTSCRDSSGRFVDGCDAASFGFTAEQVRQKEADALFIIDCLAESGFDLNAPGDGGITPLMQAALSYPTIAERLVTRGADLKRTDFKGMSALAYAVETRNGQTLKMLIDRGLSPLTQPGLCTSLSPQSPVDAEIIQVLKEAGATDCPTFP